MKNPNILKITIGIPAYNEENNIADIITKLKKITNSTLVGAGTILVGVVLLITAILLYSLISVVREKRY